MKNPRKKKRPKPQKKVEERKGAEGVVENEEEETKRRVLDALVDAFSLSSIREASIAYDIAGCDPDRASEILRKGLSEDSFSCCSSSYSGGSSGGGTSSLGMELGSKEEGEQNCGEGVVVGVSKGEAEEKGGCFNWHCFNGFGQGAEQFLCSMLGEDCDLNLAVVRDVLCQCGYDIERASNVLLDLAGSTIEKSNTDRHPNYRVDNIGDGRVFVDPNDSLIDRRSESTSISSDGDISDNIWSLGSFGRKYAEVLSNSKVDFAISSECTKSDIPLKVSDIPQKVLESLFNFPKSTEHEKDSMNWRNVVKKIQSLGPGFNVSPHVAESQQRTYGGLGACHPRQPESEQGEYIMHFWQDYP
ncbi:hypothetical protein ACSQ67_026342 [Phaseolus vulgaris]